ncbi:MAG: rhomboid family intramembrane serine protease [Thermodesulfobacteriota bacterium]
MIPLKDDVRSSTFPVVTILIIAVNVAVFIYQIGLGRGVEVFIYRAAAIPYEITHLRDIGPHALVPIPFTIFTAMFVHGGLFHVGGNMLFLWIFGDNIEDRFGHLPYLFFYLFAGVVASMFHIIMSPSAVTPMIGASGAIAGVLGAYFILFPRAQVKTLLFLLFFVTIVRVPAVVFLGIWFFFQLLSSGAGSDGIAWYAHIGGFVTGVAVVYAARWASGGRGLR